MKIQKVPHPQKCSSLVQQSKTMSLALFQSFSRSNSNTSKTFCRRRECVGMTTLSRTRATCFRKHKRTPHKRFSKMISLNAKNLESVLLAEPQLAVMFPCRTLTRSAKVSCRTLQNAEPKALNSEKDYLAEPRNAGSFRKCPMLMRAAKTTTMGHKTFLPKKFYPNYF